MSQTLDDLLLEWLDATPSVPRRDRQALLLKELMSVHTLRTIRLGRDEDSAQLYRDSGLLEGDALAERETRLCAALRNTVLEVVDISDARKLAECISVSTDLDVLYGALDLQCSMTLRVSGDGVRQRPQQLRGVDDIINELSEFQESVLLLRVDLSSSPGRCRNTGSSNTHSGPAQTSPHTIAVRGVSPVKSWMLQCAAEVEVGTQVTYYADADCTHAIFDLRSAFLFSPDGTKVERIAREMLPRGGHHLDDLLRVLHFGSFQL